MKNKKRKSKAEILIYVVILLWVFFGILGIYYSTNLMELAGYYASLSVFVGTYFWGEYKRTSFSTSLLEKGPNSIREKMIYVTVTLWFILGVYGILKQSSLNDLTVYFASLSPFVSSFIIYKTTKGNDIPIIPEKETEEIIN